MGFSSFDFDVVTSPEEQEAVLARLREKSRRSADQPAPDIDPGGSAGEE
ncbi:MAG TPA: hypothetical protein VIJ55_12275 [Acetobacteraceae bacterium]